MDPRLRRAIATPKIQQHAEEVVRLALAALDDLKQLDESLYERFVESRRAPQDRASVEARIRKLSIDTFRGMLELLSYCRLLLKEQPVKETELEMLDFGDLEAGIDAAQEPSAASSSDNLELGSEDIGLLLDNLDEGAKQSDTDVWSAVVEKLSSIEYGLRTQHNEAMSRLEIAIHSGEIGQVLGVLDDATGSSTEGVQAVVAAVYSAFVPEVDTATIVPKYLTSLGRALLVRRALAELNEPLAFHNRILQDEHSSPEATAAALSAVRDLMRGFVKSPVCHAMRPADRVQMEELEQQLREEPDRIAKLTAEGIVKYVESLGSINQREVLVQHDRRTLDEMRESLAAARQLFDLSPRTASDMLVRAYHAAQRLRGRRFDTDAMIHALDDVIPAGAPEAGGMPLLEALEALLAAAGG